MHPKTRGERRKINYKIAVCNVRDAIVSGMYHVRDLPLGKFVNQDAFDCGRKNCGLCHRERRGKPISKEGDE